MAQRIAGFDPDVEIPFLENLLKTAETPAPKSALSDFNAGEAIAFLESLGRRPAFITVVIADIVARGCLDVRRDPRVERVRHVHHDAAGQSPAGYAWTKDRDRLNDLVAFDDLVRLPAWQDRQRVGH